MENRVSSCPVPVGVLLVIGGHENKGKEPDKELNGAQQPAEILETFIKLLDKKDANVEVITSGSSEGKASFKEYKKVFTDIGLKNVGHIHHDRRADVLHNDEIIERIRKADGIFISGGDQLKLTAIYGGTRLLTVMKERYIYERLVIAGTSAGAMALSTPMIYAGNKDVQQIAGEVKITTGLEFIKDVCIDTHFVDRSRFVRMAQVVTTNPTSIGLGIEEDTALIVRNGTETEIIGSGVVIVIEGFNITDSSIRNFGQKEKIFIDNLNVKILAKGDCYKIPQFNPPHF